tara:strand:+ start:56 stop:1870 length:1815 start_codon:yes stop_codon:yes gene_type:complete
MTVNKNIAITDNLLQKKNVIGITHGTKIINGIDTGIECVVIEVKEKLPSSDIEDVDLIPSILSDEMTMTDVIVRPQYFALGRCPTAPSAGCPDHTSTHGAIKGGIQIGNGTSSGTLGAIVRDQATDMLVGLTNAHITGLVYDPQGYDWTANPNGVPDYGFPNEVPTTQSVIQTQIIDHAATWGQATGHAKQAYPMRFNITNAVVLPNYIDAAVFHLDTALANSKYPSPIPHDSVILGKHVNTAPIFDFTDIDDLNDQNICIKIGARTGRTPMPPDSEYNSANGHVEGVIDDADYATVVNYGPGAAVEDEWTASFIHCIRIKLNNYSSVSSPNWQFSAAGDSGSCVWIWVPGRDRWEILGLVFAGGGSEADHRTVVCRIDYIMKSLLVGEGWIDGGLYNGMSLDNYLYPVFGGTYTSPLSDVADSTGLWDGSISVPCSFYGGTYNRSTLPSMQFETEPTYKDFWNAAGQSWRPGPLCYEATGNVRDPAKITHDLDPVRISNEVCATYDVTIGAHDGNDRFELNGVPHPEIHIKPEVVYTFKLTNESMNGGPHPFIINKYPSGVIEGPFNTTTVFLSATITEATSSWWEYTCLNHGITMGNNIFMQ